MDTNDLSKMVAELEGAFREVQQPRTPFQLRHFIIGQHDTEPQQYAQCVLELQIKYDNIRRAMLHKRKIELEIEALEQAGDAISLVEADIKRLDIEEQDRAMLGAMREFEVLYGLWRQFPKRYTRADLDAGQEEYWVKRLTRQANLDLLAGGRVSVGNADALRMIGRSPLPQLDHVRDVERRYLESGDCKVLVAVPTVEKAEGGLPCLEGLIIPSGVQAKYYNVWGRSTADAYNDAAMTLLNDGADFLLTVEDDTFPPSDALVRLLEHFEGNTDKLIVGAWYPKRNKVREGVPIVLDNGRRRALEADGEAHECYTLPQGCTLFPAQVFLSTEHPWFVTTEHLSQDSFFSQKAREAGYTLLCDTAIRCRHIDRITKAIYEKPMLERRNSKVVLHLGCGPRGIAQLPEEFEGWQEIRVDVDPKVSPDLVASICNLGAIADDFADAIWTSHSLEHLAAHEVGPALVEFRRVLIPEGLLALTVPDMEAGAQQIAKIGDLDAVLYESPAGPISAVDVLYGHRPSIMAGNVYMAHRTGFTALSLERQLMQAGFMSIEIERSDLALWCRAHKGKEAINL